MNFMDCHTHNRRCGHAKGEIEDYVKKAIEKNINEIGISDHFPLGAVIDDPQLNERFERASMSVEEFPSYIEEIKNLQEKYKNKISWDPISNGHLTLRFYDISFRIINYL